MIIVSKLQEIPRSFLATLAVVILIVAGGVVLPSLPKIATVIEDAQPADKDDIRPFLPPL